MFGIDRWWIGQHLAPSKMVDVLERERQVGEIRDRRIISEELIKEVRGRAIKLRKMRTHHFFAWFSFFNHSPPVITYSPWIGCRSTQVTKLPNTRDEDEKKSKPKPQHKCTHGQDFSNSQARWLDLSIYTNGAAVDAERAKEDKEIRKKPKKQTTVRAWWRST